MKERKNERILVYRENRKIEIAQDHQKKLLPIAQKVVDEAKKHDMQFKDMNALIKLCENPKEYTKKFFEDKIQPVEVGGGIKLKREAILEMVETPNIDKLLDSVWEARRNQLLGYYFTLQLQSGEVSVNVKAMEKFIEDNSIYAETDEEIEALNLLQAIEENLIKLKRFGMNRNSFSDFFVFGIDGVCPQFNSRIFGLIKQKLKEQNN